jgi:hypothetical protein
MVSRVTLDKFYGIGFSDIGYKTFLDRQFKLQYCRLVDGHS